MVLTQSFQTQLGYWIFAFGNLPCPYVDTMASIHFWLLVSALRFPFGSCVVPPAWADPDINLHVTLPHLSFSHSLRPFWLQLLWTQAHAFGWKLEIPSSGTWQPVAALQPSHLVWWLPRISFLLLEF